jgi:hypothetical protein
VAPQFVGLVHGEGYRLVVFSELHPEETAIPGGDGAGPAKPALSIALERITTDAVEGTDPDCTNSTAQRGTATWNGKPADKLTIRWEDQQFFVPRKGDTIASIAHRQARFSSSDAWEPSAKNPLTRNTVEAVWLAAILERNPGLNESTLAKPHQVLTPDEDAVTDKIRRLRPLN